MHLSIVNPNISKFNKLQLIPNFLTLNFFSFLKVLSFFIPPPVIVAKFLMPPAKGSAEVIVGGSTEGGRRVCRRSLLKGLLEDSLQCLAEELLKGLPRHRRSGAQMRFVAVIHIKSSVFMPRHRRQRTHIRFVALPCH